MRVLIAYDGSTFSEAAISDLSRAGLPNDTEARIFRVAERHIDPISESVVEDACIRLAGGVSFLERSDGNRCRQCG